MKKAIGVILAAIALVLMAASLTLVSNEFLWWCKSRADAISSSPWWSKILKWLFRSRGVRYCIVFAFWTVLIILGSLLNYCFGKAGYVLTFVFGILFYGAFLYLVMWGPCKVVGKNVMTDMLNFFPTLGSWFNRSLLLYCGAGVMLFGCIVSLFARMLIGTVRKPRKGKPARAMAGTAMHTTSSRDAQREVYVRDPWGNFIRQEDYDARVNRERNGNHNRR